MTKICLHIKQDYTFHSNCSLQNSHLTHFSSLSVSIISSENLCIFHIYQNTFFKLLFLTCELVQNLLLLSLWHVYPQYSYCWSLVMNEIMASHASEICQNFVSGIFQGMVAECYLPPESWTWRLGLTCWLFWLIVMWLKNSYTLSMFLLVKNSTTLLFLRDYF